MDEQLDRLAADVARLAAQAQLQLDELLAANRVTMTALLAIQDAFAAAFLALMAQALSAVPGGNVWNVRQVRDIPVGDIALSQRLYRHGRQTANEVTALLRQHAQGVQQARALALRLYDGYDPQDGIRRPLEGSARAALPKALRLLTADREARTGLQRVYEQGMRYAANLKTAPLKAAYMESLDAWQRGAGQAALQRRLEVAHKEKTRYMANRIAQSELARAHQHELAAELIADSTIEVVQVVLSASHPRPDICDLHARANLYGLGPGCYPKARAPRPIYHPFCRCRLRSRPDLAAADARQQQDGEQAFLRGLPEREAAQVMGSKGRLAAVLKGEDALAVVNAGQEERYRTVRLGEVEQSRRTMQDDTYALPQPGEPHYGFLENVRRTQGVTQLHSGIRSFTERIAEHEGWIANPFSKPGVGAYPSQDIARWVNEKWPADIERIKQQRAIYAAVLKEKERGSGSGGS